MSQTLLSITEASKWASDYIDRPVTQSNISYLLQYAKIEKCYDKEKNIKIKQEELKNYYDKEVIKKQQKWKKKLGDDLSWELSFSYLRESDTTKHIHRLHPYKGKFIPQLVECFLDKNLNNFKRQIFFKEGDIILDPFMGSGTTLIQSCELALHSIGIDVSKFNCLISKAKLEKYDLIKLDKTLRDICFKTRDFSQMTFTSSSKGMLKEKLAQFNNKHFPNPKFKNDVRKKIITNEKEYGKEKLEEFLKENGELIKNNTTKDKTESPNKENFLNKWFSNRIKRELCYYINLLEKVEDEKIKDISKIILSRTARSCRATKHSDLATLKQPQIGPYYCGKHKKLCTPINSIIKHLIRYTYDTIKRVEEFSKLRKDVNFQIIYGDSREVDIFKEIKKQNPDFFKLLSDKKIDGVFTSPPYVGQIDYHEQHAYSYELFNIPRKDNKEIGPLYKGQGKSAREDYIKGISKVLKNISKFIKDDGNYFIVANDKYKLYPLIAEKSNLKIVNTFKRPVLNRTEKDRQPYAEIIFHMRKINEE